MATVNITDPHAGASTSVDYTWPLPTPAAPTPAPSGLVTLFGSSVSTQGDTQAQAWARISKALGSQLTRIYDNQGGLGAALLHAEKCGWPQVPTHISCEYGIDPATHKYVNDFATGKYDSDFLGAALKLTGNDFWTIDHEMDAKVHDGRYTPAEFNARWRYFVTLARKNGVKARNVQVFTGYDIANRLKTLWAGDDYVDVIGVDPYVHDPAETAQSKIGPIIAAIRKVTNKPIAICETGATFANPIGYVQSLKWLKGQVLYVCYFNSTDTKTKVNYSIDGEPATAQAYRTLAAAR